MLPGELYRHRATAALDKSGRDEEREQHGQSLRSFATQSGAGWMRETGPALSSWLSTSCPIREGRRRSGQRQIDIDASVIAHQLQHVHDLSRHALDAGHHRLRVGQAGIAFGETNEVASIFAKPAWLSASSSAILSCVETNADSICSASREDTSFMYTRSRCIVAR
jgi:hypothetical protein